MQRLIHLILSLTLGVAIVGIAYDSATPPRPAAGLSTLQDGTELSPPLQMAVSEAIGQDDTSYHFQANEAGYTATNPAHQFTISASDNTLTVALDDESWQLLSATAAKNVSLVGNRLTLHRDGYDEWYINGPVGLQQGFTVYEPADIAFTVGGTLLTTARPQNLSIGDMANFSGLMAYDANEQTVPVAFELDDNRLVYAYDDTNATYPLTIDPWMQQAKLLPNDGAADDYFGWSVALDGNTALVGAIDDDDNRTNSGSVYVFMRSGTTWSQQAKLTAADGRYNDHFGSAVALDGDTALIGADSDYYAESAYVFVRSGTTWSQQAKLTAADAGPDVSFGSLVALDGDTALIGAWSNYDHGLESGSAYVFVRNGTTWSQQAKFLPSDVDSWDYFGIAVALDGDTALVGASGSGSAGSVYVFVRSGTTWSQQQKLLASDVAPIGRFGSSVALDGDTALIGAQWDSDNAYRAGSAYIFTRSDTTWSQQAKLTASDSVAEDDLGIRAALDDDTALVGANKAVYVFMRIGNTWSQQAKLTDTRGFAYPSFGAPVSLDGDTALIGAFIDNSNGINSGSAYVFYRAPNLTLAASATCNGPNVEVTITSGDGPFNITASAGINTPINGVNVGTTTIAGPEKWDNLTVTETSGDLDSINLGQFKCRSDERPVPLAPAHQSHITNPFPLFSWTAITDANDYRVFVFDDGNPSTRTVDIRQNSGGSTSMQLATPLPTMRLFWRVRGRVNRVWSLWSIRFTLFVDPVVMAPAFAGSTPVPSGADGSSPPNSRDGATPVPTIAPPPSTDLPQPPNPR